MISLPHFNAAVKGLCDSLLRLTEAVEAAGERIAEAIDYHSGRTAQSSALEEAEHARRAALECHKCGEHVTLAADADVPEFPTCDGCEHFEQRARDDV